MTREEAFGVGIRSGFFDLPSEALMQLWAEKKEYPRIEKVLECHTDPVYNGLWVLLGRHIKDPG